MTIATFPTHLANCAVAISACLFLWAAQATAEEIDNAAARAFNAAAALQNAGLPHRAAEKWRGFISEFPKDERIGRAHYYLGVCQLSERKFAEASGSFKTVLVKWPDLRQADRAQFNLAMAQYELSIQTKNRDSILDAAEEFGKVEAKYPNSDLIPDALFYQGDCHVAAKDLPAAVSVFKNLITRYPSTSRAARAHYDLGITQQDLGRPADAAKTYQQFLSSPENANHQLATEIRLRLAICLVDTEQLDAAATELEMVAQQSEFDMVDYAVLRLGQTRMAQKKYLEAAKLLSEFPKRFRDSDYRAEAIKTAGQCYFLANQPQQAVRILPAVAGGKDRVAAEAAYWLSQSQLKLNQPEKALVVLERALQRVGKDPLAPSLEFARIDALYAIADRRHDAPKLFKEFWQRYPQHELARRAGYMAAFSSFGLGDYQTTIDVAEQFLSQEPAIEDGELTGDVTFLAAESYLLRNPEDADARKKAETHYQTLVANQPSHRRAGRSHVRIGWCLQAADKHQQTVDYLSGQLSKLDKQRELPEAQQLLGQSFAKLDQHPRAIEAFDAAINANGDWKEIDEVLVEAAKSYRALQQSDQATDRLKTLVTNHRESNRRPEALYLLGVIAQNGQQPDQAIVWFRQITDEHTGSEFAGPALHAVSSLYLEKQEYKEARQWATRLIDGEYAGDLKQRGHLIRGLAASRERDYEAAAGDLDGYLKKPVDDEQTATAIYALALCRIGQKQFDDGRKRLAELAKSKPEFENLDRAFYELGHALRSEEGKAADAEAAFAWITLNRPASPLAAEAWFRVAQSQVDKASASEKGDQKDEFLATAEEALENSVTGASDELFESVTFLLGDVQFQRRRYAEAAKTMTQYVDKVTDGKYTGPATFLAAQSRYELEQFDQALSLYVKTAAADFGDTDGEQIKAYRTQSLFRAGTCAAKLMKWRESQSHFQALIDQHPSSAQQPDARYGVAFALQQQNKLDQAINAYHQVTEETETETAAKARFMIGEIEFARNKYEDAIEQFLIVTVGYPYESWQALARFETARCFVELGDKQRAASTLREMIDKHPDHPRAADAKNMLDKLN